MFENDVFVKWLDEAAEKAMEKVTASEALSQQEIMFLLLKAQTNHITHLDVSLHGEVKKLREDSNTRFAEINTRFEEVNTRFEEVNRCFEEVREDMNRRFQESREESNRRFEDMNRRFEESREDVNRRFEEMNSRFSFIQWLISIGFVAMGTLMTVFKFF